MDNRHEGGYDIYEPQQGDEPSRWQRTAAAVALVAVAAAGCSFGHGHGEGGKGRPPATAGAQDLIGPGTWDYMPGTVKQGGRLAVHRTGEATLKLATPGRPPKNPSYVANPPVNTYGTRLQMADAGNVRIAGKLTDIQGAATLSVLSAPNVRFDERIEHDPGVAVTVQGATAQVRVWESGPVDRPAVTKTLALGAARSSADIAIAQSGDDLTVAVGGRQTTVKARVLDHQAWFGFDASNTWTLRGLTAAPLAGNRITQVDMSKAYASDRPAPNGLARIAAGHGHGQKLIGTAVDLPVLMRDPEYTRLVINNFNELETETLAKFQALQPEEGTFEFAELDALVHFAESHNMQVHGHALAFTEAYPQWLSDKLGSPHTTRAEAIGLLRNHIQTVVSRYDGKHGHGTINYWDVVNEPFDPNDWGKLNKQSIWQQKIGPQYIALAFQFAHAANPQAQLGLNDWAFETDSDRRQAGYHLVKQLRARGVPISFVGFQAHFDEDTLNDSQVMDQIYSGKLTDYFKQFAGLGVQARLSEVSVAENNDPKTQADVYGMLLQACMQAGNCFGFNMWGATNNRYYMTSNPVDGIGNDAPTTQRGAEPISQDGPAMQALRTAAAGN